MSFQKLHQKILRRIEITISQLSDQSNIGRIRARTHRGFRTRLSNKFSGFTLGVFLNKCLVRKLIALKDYNQMKTKKVISIHLSYAIINVCDSRRIGIIKNINPYRIRVGKIAP